jgi:hypothetical protein
MGNTTKAIENRAEAKYKVEDWKGVSLTLKSFFHLAE